MKKTLAILLLYVSISFAAHSQLLKKIGDKIKSKSEKKADTPSTTTDPASTQSTTTTGKDTTGETAVVPALNVYANYDFVPGDTVMFEDHFADDQDGEFPSHWNLEKGQGILNKMGDAEVFMLTDGNYGIVTPLTKTKSYLTNPFTIEYDNYNPENAAYGLMVFFKDAEGQDIGNVHVTPGDATCTYADGKELSGTLRPEIEGDNFKNKWHHIAIAYKNKQIKVYVDQFRVLVVPNSGITPASVTFGGIGDPTNPIIFKNIRIAEGGGMNMIGRKFTETKIVTHGINFDVNKAIIKPESMGTLNMIVQVMKDNPDVKFEIGGHTDSDGADATNMQLSQQRSEAVKDQLIKMGVDPSRLTAKGYGESKPVSDNTTPEGKANNRRVEFTKI